MADQNGGSSLWADAQGSAPAVRSCDPPALLPHEEPPPAEPPPKLPDEVLVLRVTDDGTEARLLDDIPAVAGDVAAGLPTSDTVQSLIDPPDLTGLRAVGASRAR